LDGASAPPHLFNLSGEKHMSGKQGFASMDPEKRRRIASLGGKTAQAKGNSHKFTSEGAREAGRKGGRISQERRALNR
jgi:general stress protein YciG